MKLSNNFNKMKVKAQRQHGTSCIVLRRSLSPMHRRSNRKVTSHLNSSKPYSSKHLHSTLILTSMKCAGSQHVQMKFSTCMAQKSLRQRTPKWRSPPEKYISAGCKIPPFVVFKLQTLPNQALMTVCSPNQVLVSSC